MYILYSRPTSPTGRALAIALGAKGGTLLPPSEEDVVIRWGMTTPLSSKPKIEINSREAILKASDKFGTLKTLADAKVNVPPFWKLPSSEIKFPALGRKIHHTRGTDIRLFLQQSDVVKAQGKSDYAIQYIPTFEEYRIHVVRDRIIKVSQKIRTNPNAKEVPWIRNHARGYTYRKSTDQLEREQKRIAVAAVEALGLDFGAVDLIVGDDRKTYVLEINTAPGLIDSGIDKYVAAFQRVISRKKEKKNGR